MSAGASLDPDAVATFVAGLSPAARQAFSECYDMLAELGLRHLADHPAELERLVAERASTPDQPDPPGARKQKTTRSS
jgi:hypothetical protein